MCETLSIYWVDKLVPAVPLKGATFHPWSVKWEQSIPPFLLAIGGMAASSGDGSPTSEGDS